MNVGKLYKWKQTTSYKGVSLPPPHSEYKGTFVRKEPNHRVVFNVDGKEFTTSSNNRFFLVPQHPASKEIRETSRKVPSLENAAKLRLSTAEMAAVREHIPGHRKEGGTRKQKHRGGERKELDWYNGKDDLIKGHTYIFKERDGREIKGEYYRFEDDNNGRPILIVKNSKGKLQPIEPLQVYLELTLEEASYKDENGVRTYRAPPLEKIAYRALRPEEKAAVHETIPGYRPENIDGVTYPPLNPPKAGTRKRKHKNGTKRSRWIYI